MIYPSFIWLIKVIPKYPFANVAVLPWRHHLEPDSEERSHPVWFQQIHLPAQSQARLSCQSELHTLFFLFLKASKTSGAYLSLIRTDKTRAFMENISWVFRLATVLADVTEVREDLNYSRKPEDDPDVMLPLWGALWPGTAGASLPFWNLAHPSCRPPNRSQDSVANRFPIVTKPGSKLLHATSASPPGAKETKVDTALAAVSSKIVGFLLIKRQKR